MCFSALERGRDSGVDQRSMVATSGRGEAVQPYVAGHRNSAESHPGHFEFSVRNVFQIIVDHCLSPFLRYKGHNRLKSEIMKNKEKSINIKGERPLPIWV